MFLLFLLLSLCSGQKKERYTIKFENNNVSAVHFARSHNLRFIKNVLGFSVFESTDNDSKSKRSIAGLYADVPIKKFKRAAENSDPLFPMQWHLHGNQFSVNVVADSSGLGIPIAIVDDGLQHIHPDIQANYNADLSWDYSDNDSDPSPGTDEDGHGTACAGVAAAVQNNICGRGVAYKASIVGIRALGRPLYDYEEAEALTHKSDKIRIFSCSWGPQDDGRRMDGPGPVTREALKQEKAIYVWASGNGRQHHDNSNYDGYANSPYVIAIGASDYLGRQSEYSESGANLFALAPSSGGGKGIITSDLMGRAGYSQGSCTFDFGGTSSAAPLAAGVIALILEKHPHLNARDIMHIIAKAGRYQHTHETGFGILKVPDLLQTALLYKGVPPRRKVLQKNNNMMIMIPKGYNNAVINITAPDALEFIEHVLCTVDMTHGRRGQVFVSLKSPVSESLLSEHRDDTYSGQSVWTFSSVHHWKERLKVGDVWEIKVRDDIYNNYHGHVNSISVEWWGF